MTKEEVIEFYKGASKVAKALRINKSSVSSWGDAPPRGIQFELEAMTGGRLKADREAPRTGRRPKLPNQRALTTSAP